MILHNKRIVITQITVVDDDWGGKKQSGVVLFDGLGNHWDATKSEPVASQLARETVDQVRDVTIPKSVNDIQIGDTAELFDTNGASL